MKRKKLKFKKLNTERFSNKREIVKTFFLEFVTRRLALTFQRDIRIALFNSLTLYDFKSLTFSRTGYKSIYHWTTKITNKRLEIKVTRVKIT
jgi:hypothetical protein